MIKDKLPIALQEKIQKIANLLSPHTKRAYLVGGSIRDMFLDNKIEDLDIEVYDISYEKFDALMQKYNALGVGKSFFVYKLFGIDLALPRVEKKTGLGHKAFDVIATQDEKIASRRRDFSMNAMMINIFTGELLDFWCGQESIKKKELSLIDEQSFKEDSLRVLRAIQFCARFGFEIEERTFEVMKSIDLSDLSKPRVLWEFEKLFLAKHLDVGFVYMCRLGIFEKLFACKIKEEDILKVMIELKEAKFVEDLRAYYFFYIVANICGFNPVDWLKKLEAPNHYFRVFKNQPFKPRTLSNKELLRIAIDMPIKEWLGNYRDGVKEQAKRLNVYDTVFTGGVKITQIIEDGFVKEDIKIEYKRRVMEKISELYT